MCLNRKVLIGLAALALGIFVFDPSLVGHALPLLLVAICPLSMVFMMWGMRKTRARQGMSGSGQSCGMSAGSMAPMDRGQVGVASPGSATEDEVARLRAENDQLRAEQATRTQGEGVTS